MSVDKEVWLPVVGYEGKYEVSNFGAVRTLGRKTPAGGGILKPHIINVGYARVDLADGHGNQTHNTVHRLVATAFVPAVEGKTCVNHIDSNRANNRADNLEWCTYKENTAHMIAKGRFKNNLLTPGVFEKTRLSRLRNKRLRDAQRIGVKE